MWHIATHSITAQIIDFESVAVGARDVEDVSTSQREIIHHDGVTRVGGGVITNVQVRDGPCGDDLVRVSDHGVAAAAIILQGEQTAIVDGHRRGGRYWAGGGASQSRERQRARIDGDVTVEGVVVAEHQIAEALLGESVAIGVSQHHIQDQRSLRRVDRHCRVTKKIGSNIIAV